MFLSNFNVHHSTAELWSFLEKAVLFVFQNDYTRSILIQPFAEYSAMDKKILCASQK